MERRYDIDWLRVIAIGLLIVYHTSIGFQPWAALIGFIQNSESLSWIWYPMAMLNMWRIPILFFVSGMGVYFSMRKRSFTQVLLERSKRILIPLIFGIFAIVPIHILIWQSYYHQDITYQFGRGHLWFLANISSYVVLLLPLFFLMKKMEAKEYYQKWILLLKHPWVFLMVSLSFIAISMLFHPEIYTFYAISWHGYCIGLASFFFGYLFVSLGDQFWKGISFWKWAYFSIASLLFTIRIIYFDMNSPLTLMSIESIAWIFSVFGFSYQYLKKPGKALTYSTPAAYPIYIIHMIMLFGVSYLIFPLNLAVIIKYIITNFLTLFISFLIYEYFLKRCRLIQLFFGINPIQKKS